MTAASHVLVARLDSMGDMLVSGPAVRAVSACAAKVTVLAGPQGRAAARLLPGVDEVRTWSCPWIAADPQAVERAETMRFVDDLARAEFDEALVLTSYHQSALPTALLLRLAGVRRICAVSDDYPGSLLDVRIASPEDGPEPERMLAIARAAGYRLPDGDDGRLAVRLPVAPALATLPSAPYVVVHPGASAPARAYPSPQWRLVVAALVDQGRSVVITGSEDETALTAYVAGGASTSERVHDLGGRLDLAALARVLASAAVVVVANTGPAHLAAAVGTPVVSLFSPVVPAVRWGPYGVPTRMLGDQSAACRQTRARVCPVEGHPCLARVGADEVADAVAALAHNHSANVHSANVHSANVHSANVHSAAPAPAAGETVGGDV